MDQIAYHLGQLFLMNLPGNFFRSLNLLVKYMKILTSMNGHYENSYEQCINALTT